ncbi:MAG: NAD(P)/FAD-dependent oxidoreductase, partial [Candidatus Heimdallarchaeota archaeon]|nr:NAD(P)/FAD-dependent oxidoreductase [Candidatus Heimdallarchaeota archaeon]
LEQHYAPGGYISGFKRKGYYFDSGAEGLVFCGENQVFKKAMDGLGLNLDLLSIDPVEVLHYPDKTITMHANPDKYIAELKRNYPENKEEIERFFDVLRKINHAYNSNVTTQLDPTFKELIKIGLTSPTMRKYSLISYKDFLDKFITNEQLKDVLSVYCLWLGVPSDSISAVSAGLTFFYPIFNGHYYPKGGMFALAEKLTDSFVERGGEIQYRKKVTRILTKRRKAVGVELKDGTRINAKWIISNADLKRTVFEYVGMNKFPNRYLVKVAKKNQSVSGFSVFLGLDKELKGYPSHMAYNLEADRYIRDILGGKYDPKEVLIRIPSKIDPDLSKDGKSSVILLSFAPYGWENKWNSSDRESYEETKEKYADKLIKLAENIIPDLSKHIDVKLISTPLTFERFSLNTQGAWYGPREGSQKVGKKTPIRKLVLAGANTSGAGVPPNFFSGINTAKYIMNRFNAGKRTLRLLFPMISRLSFRARNRAVLSRA